MGNKAKKIHKPVFLCSLNLYLFSLFFNLLGQKKGKHSWAAQCCSSENTLFLLFVHYYFFSLSPQFFPNTYFCVSFSTSAYVPQFISKNVLYSNKKKT